MPTIKDVAKRAGVSPATVSRCLNGHPTVRPDLRERILEAARELKYQPNIIARSLVSDKSHLIGVVIPDIANPFFPDIVRAIEDVAAQRGYTVMLANTDWNPDKEKRVLNIFRSRQVDGVLLVPAKISQPYSDVLKQFKMPVVFVTRTIEGFDSVEVDHYKGGYLVAKHFADLGHTCIAVVGSMEDPKYAGFRKGILDSHIPESNLYAWRLSPDESNHEGARSRTLRGMAEVTERPTAIFAENDLLATGVMRALDELGLDVPQDVAVAGFDNTILASTARPALTTIAQPIYELGRLSTELLLDRIEEKELTGARHIVLEPRLVVRGSTTRLRQYTTSREESV